jgi:hypothetical protein
VRAVGDLTGALTIGAIMAMSVGLSFLVHTAR